MDSWCHRKSSQSTRQRQHASHDSRKLQLLLISCSFTPLIYQRATIEQKRLLRRRTSRMAPKEGLLFDTSHQQKNRHLDSVLVALGKLNRQHNISHASHLAFALVQLISFIADAHAKFVMKNITQVQSLSGTEYSEE